MKFASRLRSIAVLGLLVLPLLWLSGSAAARPAPQTQVAPDASSRAAADPIVGVWTYSCQYVFITGGQTACSPKSWDVGLEVAVTASGGGFVGTVTKKPEKKNRCYLIGAVLWRISGSGGTYTGTLGDCSADAYTFRVQGGRLLKCIPTSSCQLFTRSRATTPTPTGARAPLAGVWQNNANGRISTFWYDGASGYFVRAYEAFTQGNGCAVKAGDMVGELAPAGKRWTLRVKRFNPPGCAPEWGEPVTVRVTLSRDRKTMTMYCGSQFTDVCYRFTKVGD